MENRLAPVVARRHDEAYEVGLEGSGAAFSVDSHQYGANWPVGSKAIGERGNLRLGEGAIFPDLESKLRRQAGKWAKRGKGQCFCTRHGYCIKQR